MTYATVASLLQTLDYLLKFTHLIFKGLEIQGRSLVTISQYEPVMSSFFFKEMYEEAQGLLLEMKEIKVGEIQRVLQHLSSPSSSRLHQVTHDDANAATYRQFVDECILLNQTFKENITVSCHVHKEITDLYQDLRFLLTYLDNFPKTSDFLLKRIKCVTERARYVVEEYIAHAELDPMDHLLKRAQQIFTPKLLQQIPFSSSTRDNGIGPAVLRFNRRVKNAIFIVKEILHHPSFDGNSGIRRSLFRAFEEIKVLITDVTRNMNDEKISLKSSSISPRDSKQEIVVTFDDEQLILEGLTRLPSGLEIVTIVGMGGIGKTTLAKKLYNHPCYHFDCRAWITISQVYQFRDLLLGLLSALVGRSDKMMEKSNAQLAEDLYKSLKGKRYLIAMDDMWSIDAWNDLKSCFPDDEKIGSRIIVTSRHTEVANYVNPKKPPYFMNLLHPKRSWEMLENLVFGIASCSHELVEVGKEIAKRCCGLPLAIVVIAGILCSTIRTLGSWKHIANNLSSIVSTDPEQCLDVLSLSYIYLPHHLRACFLYMGVFPEDGEIQTQKLINLWVAEGFIFSDNRKNLEQIAEEYLEDLISRNLVLVEKRHVGGKVKSCRLHDFIREVCLREAQKENFMDVVRRGSSNNFPADLRNHRRLSIHLDSYSVVAAASELPRLSSFLCFTLGSNIVPDILFYQLEFRLLRVLDIYFLHFEYFPEPILKLIHLRYLALKVNYEIPAEISQLRNLQTFVIQGPCPCRGSDGSPTLPLMYWRMPSLRHLRCSVACQLWDPSTFQHDLWQEFAPEYLQTLSVICFSSCRKEVFSVMPGLKRLEICETTDDYSSDRPCHRLKDLVYLQELEILKCCFYKGNREAILGWDVLPVNLKRLSLKGSCLSWDRMKFLASLPKLETLKLKDYAFQGPEWVLTDEVFGSLKQLLIDNTDLVNWEAESTDHFPCLERLVLRSCRSLEKIPCGVGGLSVLDLIELRCCSESAEDSAREFQKEYEGFRVVTWNDRTPDSA